MITLSHRIARPAAAIDSDMREARSFTARASPRMLLVLSALTMANASHAFENVTEGR
jgi:hypothetical protein